MSRIISADIMARINPNLSVQVIIFQQHRLGRVCCPAIADKFFGVLELCRAARMAGQQSAIGHPIRRYRAMRDTVQRRHIIKQGFGAANDFRPAHRIIGPGRCQIARLVNRISAVKRIIKRAPSRIGGIDGKAGIFNRNNQLRAGDFGNLIINIGSFNREIRPFRH